MKRLITTGATLLLFFIIGFRAEGLPTIAFRFHFSQKLEPRVRYLVANTIYDQLNRYLNREIEIREREYISSQERYLVGGRVCSTGLSFFIDEYAGEYLIKFMIYELDSGRVAGRPHIVNFSLSSLRVLESELAVFLRQRIIPRL